MEKVKEKESTEEKAKKLLDFMPKQDDTSADDAALLAKLIDADGEMKVDLELPQEYLLESVSELLLSHLTSYHNARQNWRAARNLEDHKKAEGLFAQMKFNQLSAAIIQNEFPKAKKIADDIAKYRAKETKVDREKKLKE